jgi:hypothetical protein
LRRQRRLQSTSGAQSQLQQTGVLATLSKRVDEHVAALQDGFALLQR